MAVTMGCGLAMQLRHGRFDFSGGATMVLAGILGVYYTDGTNKKAIRRGPAGGLGIAVSGCFRSARLLDSPVRVRRLWFLADLGQRP